jgi:hypothetical protein
LFLRRQFAIYKERGLKPQRLDAGPRENLAFLSRLFDWRSALVVVRPESEDHRSTLVAPADELEEETHSQSLDP